MSLEDSLLAIQNGSDAIWVSNNGGRQLDTQPSTIQVLKAISQGVKAFSPKVEIYMDSGVCRGGDILKALALGAQVVFMERPIIYGLHYSGKEGVLETLNLINEEFKTAMCLTHTMEVQKITEEQVIHKVDKRFRYKL